MMILKNLRMMVIVTTFVSEISLKKKTQKTQKETKTLILILTFPYNAELLKNLDIKIQNLLVFVINNFNGINSKEKDSDFFTKECYLLFLKVLVHFEIVISEIE